MLLRKLHIKNFRGIEDLAFELGPITLLIGENNSGKTTILEAIRLMLSRASGRKSGAFDAFDYRLKTADSEPQSAENVLGPKSKRPSLLQDFQKLFPVFYLSALRDAVREFRSGQFWSPFVRNPSIPDNIKADLQKQIAELNAAVLGAHTSLKTVKSHLQKVQELVPVGQSEAVEIEALPGRISDLLSNTQVSMSSPS